SLKRRSGVVRSSPFHLFSTAKCRGLIEAARLLPARVIFRRFPRLNAVASLKREREPRGHLQAGFSTAKCRGLIEATSCKPRACPCGRFSTAKCRALIEA